MVTERVRYTVAEFEAFTARPENRDRLFELIDGEIVKKMVAEEHGLIVARLIIILGLYLREHPIGRVGVEISHRTPNDDYNERLPDISFILNNERPIVRQGAVPAMPELAIEVKTYSQTYKEMHEKAAFYLANGAHAVWLVFPEKRLVETYTLNTHNILLENETLSGGDLLPDFSLSVAEIFQV
ncbi:MAG: Uma2 family endonuclease [Chloroflexi bacterium CFX4]|nr:Uma2 family endonuclease [Chloroflexi bacterium CFX4]MDL1921160.1 Uma2 family endonuclease [Chloroflexi bacterium CFX3]